MTSTTTPASTLRLCLSACIVGALCAAAGCQGGSALTNRMNERMREISPETLRRSDDGSRNQRVEQMRRSLQKEFNPDSAENWKIFYHFSVFFVALAIVSAGLIYWQLWKQKQEHWKLNDPMALIKELIYVHQLSESEKKLMQDISDRNALPTPLKLFVEPTYLLEALENDSYNVQHPAVRQLLSKLFEIKA